MVIIIDIRRQYGIWCDAILLSQGSMYNDDEKRGK